MVLLFGIMELTLRFDGPSTFTLPRERKPKPRPEKKQTSTPMLAKRYDGNDPTGWWMSEKLDGVRAIWTGSEFISRNGKVFPAPQEMKAAMPVGVKIDGELHGGRGKFQPTAGKVRSGKWDGLTFMAFDIVNSKAFEERQAQLATIKLPSWCSVVDQTECLSTPHLEQYERDLVAAGAEGVMLRKPSSKYVHSRSTSLLKLKRFKTDEAEVIGYQDGEGKHANRVGALIAKFAGETFKIGTGMTDDERETPPAIGSLVTFSFFELTDGGKPRHPVFVGVRDYE